MISNVYNHTSKQTILRQNLPKNDNLSFVLTPTPTIDTPSAVYRNHVREIENGKLMGR